ncbi:MAG: PD-(D/E)XK nuclease family protein, partial [Pseudohongiellaceae bacterium]
EHMAVDILQEPLLLKHQANEGIQGGTSLIADQADCPFRSFAKHRLHARELPRVGFGLSPAILGTIVHNALEYFWRELRDQQALLDASDEALELLISTVVSAAIARAARQYPTTMTPHFSKLEQGRLEKLLYNWLEEERKRGSFKILALEYPLQWQHSHLTLNFKVDRIEELEDKSCGLVDYKSSAHKPSVRWDDQRQDKPQLLLYQSAIDASSEFAEVTSILYAQVNIENTAYIGISQDGSSYPGTEPSCQRQLSQSLSWDELKKQWQLSLQSLADEFLSGYLAISPKSNSSCQYCHLAPLCRINEVLEP